MNSALPPSVKPSPAPMRVMGHFGELVQGRMGEDGPVALLTLPHPGLFAEAVLGAKTTDPLIQQISPALCQYFGLKALPPVALNSNIVPLSGCGSSSARLLSTIRLLAFATGRHMSATDEAALMLRLEGAVDPLMHHGDNLIWASRQARILRPLPPLPPMICVGVLAGEGRATRADDHDFPDMKNVFNQAEQACTTGDLPLLAQAASLSAKANQSRNPNPLFDDVQNALAQLGALGVAVAHTGSAIAMIFAPSDHLAAAKAGQWLGARSGQHAQIFVPG